ncbi:MAG: NAD-dependent epimerase/dehydratase family protein [Bacillota bacterium]|jgi:UDP-glucose 4-epimerase
MDLYGQKVLITGGAGFLGSHLCEKILELGGEVTVLDSMDSGRMSNLHHIQDQIRIFSGDMADENLVSSAGKGQNIVIHLAIPIALRQQKFIFNQLETATKGFFNILNFCLKERALLIHISSIAVYGNPKYTPVDEEHPLEPETMYGAVKLSEEQYIRTLGKTSGLKYVILRVSDIYGPRNTPLSTPILFLRNAIEGKPLTVFGEGTQGRTYTYVSDFVDGALLAITREEAQGCTMNISSRQFVSMLELAEAVNMVFGGKCKVIHDPSIPADKRKLDIEIKKARKILGFNPQVDIALGLKKTYDWMRQL